MHRIADWQHDHDFGDARQRVAERRTRWVIGLTATTMVVEMVAGSLTGSMALTADAWHMASHVGALSITALAYYMTRRHAKDHLFTFGTGKIATLGGFTSAVVLAMVALLIAVESLRRLVQPETVHFKEAMLVAVVGLIVNLLSARLLGRDEHHHHHQHHHHQHGADHAHERAVGKDLNLRAAYLHVLADALTSVLAIVALWTGSRYGWVWMDPLMGLVGALVIARWSYGLLRESGRILLDAEDHRAVEKRIRDLVESGGDSRIVDLHVWRVGPKSLACIASLATHEPTAPDRYRHRLAGIPGLDHITVEVNTCGHETAPAELGRGELGCT